LSYGADTNQHNALKDQTLKIGPGAFGKFEIGGAKHFAAGAAAVGLGFGAAATIKVERFFEAGAGAKAV